MQEWYAFGLAPVLTPEFTTPVTSAYKVTADGSRLLPSAWSCWRNALVLFPDVSDIFWQQRKGIISSLCSLFYLFLSRSDLTSSSLSLPQWFLASLALISLKKLSYLISRLCSSNFNLPCSSHCSRFSLFFFSPWPFSTSHLFLLISQFPSSSLTPTFHLMMVVFQPFLALVSYPTLFVQAVPIFFSHRPLHSVIPNCCTAHHVPHLPARDPQTELVTLPAFISTSPHSKQCGKTRV